MHEIEIDQTTGRAAFFSARVPAWHRLGQLVPEAVNAADALRLAHLDWTVTKEQQTVTVLSESGVSTLVSPDVATVRVNPFTGLPEILGTVSPGYEVVQNSELAPFLDAIVAESGAHFETAGSLRGGSRVFLSLKLPTGIMVGGVDRVDNYLVVTNSHDGGSSLTAVITPTRVVCANTLSVALAHNVSSVKLRHTTNVKDRMAQARQTLGVTVKYLDEFEAIANSMLATSVTNGEFDRLIKAVWPEKDTRTDKSTRGATIAANRTAKVTDLFRNAGTNEVGRGTAWGAWNAVTEYLDHFQGSGDPDRSAERVALGGTDALKRKALALLTR